MCEFEASIFSMRMGPEVSNGEFNVKTDTFFHLKMKEAGYKFSFFRIFHI